MTVSDQTNRTSVVGTGAEQEIPFTFPITSTSDITVYKRLITSGAETELDETSDYTVTIDGTSGGTITTVTPFFASTYQIHIVRDTPMTQSLDLVQGGSFNAENIETALDKSVRLIIENSNSLNRTLRFPETDADSIMEELPIASTRAGKFLYFGASDGNPSVVESITTGEATISPYGKTLIDDDNASAALTTLGFTPYGKTLIDDASAAIARGTLGLDTDDDVEFAETISTDIITKSPWFDIRAYSAVGDDDTDNTTEIQAAIDAAEAAGTDSVLFIPPGIFLADGLVIEGSMKIRGSGTLKHISPATSSLLLCNDIDEDGAAVDIDGITFDGNGVAREASAEVWSSTRADIYSTMATVQLKINNCIFTSMRDKAIRMSGPIRLTNCRFENGQPHDGTDATHYVYGVPFGADLPEGSHVIVQGNSFVGADVTTPSNYGDNPTGVFITMGTDDAGADAYYESLVISGNTFEGCGLNGGATNTTGAIDTYSGAEKVVIADNVIRKYSFCGIKAQAVDKCTITGNVMSEGYTDGAMADEKLYGIMVEEKPRDGVTDERYDVIVSNNIVDGGKYIGIFVSCDNSIVSNNIVRDIETVTLGVGIYVEGTNHIIEGNVVIECEGQSIRTVSGSSQITISGNLLDNTTYVSTAIWFSGTDKVIITNNNILCNGGSAIRTYGLSDNVFIEGNVIDAAAYGIDIRETDGANTGIIIGKNIYTNSATMNINNATTGGLTMRVIGTLDDTGTPSVSGVEYWLTGGTTAITDFDNGITYQVFTLISEHIVKITDGTNIFLNGSADFDMNPTDTLTLLCKADNKWYETGRSDNT